MALSRTTTANQSVGIQFAPNVQPVSDATTVAATAVHWALQYTAQKLAVESAGAVASLKRGDGRALSSFSYALAGQAAAHMAALDDHIKAVYLYDYDATGDDACFEEPAHLPLIHLIVWAQPKTSALASLVESLDDAIVRAYAEMVERTDHTHMLDAQFIDDGDVTRHSGPAAMLSSIHYRPIQLWQR